MQRMSAGRKTITEIKLKIMPFARLMPKSAPIPKVINKRAKKPNRVVAALAATVDMDSFMACRMASSTLVYFFLLSWKL